MSGKLYTLISFLTVFWFFCLYTGFRSQKKIVTPVDFFIFSRQLPSWSYFAIITSLLFSGLIFFFHPSLIFLNGLPFSVTSLFVITIPLVGVIFSKRQWILSKRYGYLTPSEMVSGYFKSDILRILIVIIALGFSIPFIAMQLSLGGLLLNIISDNVIGKGSASILIGAVVCVYLSAGGIRSLIIIDSIQFLLIIFGIFCVGFIAYDLVGGWSLLNESMSRIAGIKENLFNIKVDLSGRISSLFGSEYVMGSYLSRLFPIFLATTFYLFKEKKRYILLISILFIMIEILIFLSGERAAFFFNTFAAIFVIIMIRDFKKIRLMSLIVSFILITLITIVDNSAKKRIWDSTIDQIGFRTEKINIFSEVHESHYRSAYKMYLENKVIGIGVRNFRNFCHETKFQDSHKRSCTTHPHNTYVQILAELGLVGFIFFAGLFFVFLYFCIKHLHGILFKKKYYFNDFEICLLAAILISIWPLVPTGNFFNNWISIIYYYPAGFLLWSLNKKSTIK